MEKWIRIGLLVVVAGGVIGAFVFRDRLTGAADALAVGDCINLPTAEEFAEVQHQPCNEPHEAEVYVVQDWANPPETRPTEAQFEAWVTEHCLGQAFTDYVGMTYDDAAAIGAGWFSPTLAGWSDGDKEMVCYLAPVAGGKVSVSYKKAS
jgi:hypothetical protein